MQKVALGRSMIVRPAIFLLDEPFSNLDAAFRAYMRAELKRIQQDLGQTMVYVTHDQVEAMGMADRIAVMSKGVLQQYGSPDDLYNRPANLFVARFVGSVLHQHPARPLRAVDGAATVTPTRRGLAGPDRWPAARTPPTGASSPARRSRSRSAPRPCVGGADSPDATVRAKVALVEPLGARDVIHMRAGDHDVRATMSPGQRPRSATTSAWWSTRSASTCSTTPPVWRCADGRHPPGAA